MKTFQEYLNEIKTEPNLIEEVKKLRTKERQKNKNDDYSLGTIEGLSVSIDCIKENKNLTGKPLILELRKIRDSAESTYKNKENSDFISGVRNGIGMATDLI